MSFSAASAALIAPLNSGLEARQQDAKQGRQQGTMQEANQAKLEAKLDRLEAIMESKFDRVFADQQRSSMLLNYLRGKVEVMETDIYGKKR